MFPISALNKNSDNDGSEQNNTIINTISTINTTTIGTTAASSSIINSNEKSIENESSVSVNKEDNTLTNADVKSVNVSQDSESTDDVVMKQSELCEEKGETCTKAKTSKRKLDIVEQSEEQCIDNKKSKDDEEVKEKDFSDKLEEEYVEIRELYVDHLLELFFLEQHQNLLSYMDFLSWKKKPSTLPLLQYFRTHSTTDEEYEDLRTFKASIENVTSLVNRSAVIAPDFVSSNTCLNLPLAITSPIKPLAIENKPHNTSSTSPINQVNQVDSQVNVSESVTTSIITNKTIDKTPAQETSKVTMKNNNSINALSNVQVNTPTVFVNKATPKTNSISAVYEASIGSQEQIVERAKQEAYVMQRIAELRKEGLWTAKRLPKVQEPTRAKAHWDYLLEEMTWLSADFAQERKWKKAAAKKCAKMVAKYFLDKEMQVEKAQREEQLRLKKIASTISKSIREFWTNVEKLVELRQQTRLEEKRKKALDLHLNYIVDQTEKFSSWLAEGLGTDTTTSAVQSEKSEESPKEKCKSDNANDKEFVVETDEEDDEETLIEQEKKERAVDYSKELQELENEANLPIEELLEKYSEVLQEPIEDNEDDLMTSDEDTVESDSESSKEEEEEQTEDDESEEMEEDETIEFLYDENSQESATEKMSIKNDSKIEGPSRDLTDIAAGAEELQPKGNTFLTTTVATKVPFLLKHSLREYQHIGLDWLAAMYDKKLNGILADEMGLGKTIQTIALLAHLACEKGIWGPHLIVVPTSVMLNWEMEIKKWCPAFKILTYYGNPKERRAKRTGWTKPNQFHICITSYKLVIQDHQSFRRKKWKYLILDEAQHIKNFKSQRWQMLLNFNTSRRLLLTGTPLQNNLMELWSLMHFLMPNVFSSHKDFKDWFVNPVTGMIEGNHEYNEGLIKRLHKVLRPFLLRRLKSEVEKQLPKKYEHIQMCRLSKRQRFLYEEFMGLTKTKETLATGNFLSVINVLMQLRKVCNHPNLFETRPIVSPFAMKGITYHSASLATKALNYNPFTHVSFDILHSKLIESSFNLSAFAQHRIRHFAASPKLIQEIDNLPEPPPRIPRGKIRLQIKTSSIPLQKIPPITKQESPSVAQQMSTRSQQVIQLATLPTIANTPKTFVLFTTSSSTQPTNPTLNVTCTQQLSNALQKTAKTNLSVSGLTVVPVAKIGKQVILKPVNQSPASSTSIISSLPLEDSKKLNDSPSQQIKNKKLEWRKSVLKLFGSINSSRCSRSALYAPDLLEVANVNSSISSEIDSFNTGLGYFHCLKCQNKKNLEQDYFSYTETLKNLIETPEELLSSLRETVDRFVFCVPSVSAPTISMHVSHPSPSKVEESIQMEKFLHNELKDKISLLHPITSNLRTQFPELRLIQYDCGKLQALDNLLMKLKTENHRVLIFTQMSRMLDIFEQFLNYHGHTYLRLDGSTKIEQRQALMERFNADKRIFCFILSTRSGGIGVNLTGADTVIFYDSDWNPTMDAQAQDRCHRIGQTRDVHIYRLISEKTIEENIFKKAQQKRLLGDVAIEGGNFTTAFFKSTAINELFGMDIVPELQPPKEEEEGSQDVQLQAQLEQALADAEEAPDVAAAKIARDEAAAEFAEFDENIPLDVDKENEEKSNEEKELDKVIEQLMPVERYAMQFLESIQEPMQAEQLKQAEEEIEAHKKEWELGHLKSLKEEEERSSLINDMDKEQMLTISRQDNSQVFVNCEGLEQMPIWAPPTPPQDENDLYIDHSASFLYERSIMSESQLPPVFAPKGNKRLKLDSNIPIRNKPGRMKKEEIINIPRSLFDKPAPQLLKLRKELKVQKLKGLLIGGPDPSHIQKIIAAFNSNVNVPSPNLTSLAVNKSQPVIPAPIIENQPVWNIFEDWSILQVIQYLQEIPLNLLVVSPGHIPNWDLVSDNVNSVSCTYRSPKLCRHHYENVVLQREEGKLLFDPSQKKIKKQPKPVPSVVNPAQTTPSNQTNLPKLPLRTSHVYSQDSNCSFTQLCNARFDAIKLIASKRPPPIKPVFLNGGGTGKNQKHIALLQESGIIYDQPVTPHQAATNRANRIAKEKANQNALAQLKQNQQQLQQQQQQQQQANQLQQQQQQQQQILLKQPIKAVLATNTIPANQQIHAIQAKVGFNQGQIPQKATFVANVNSQSQQVANLAKALSQAANNFTNQQKLASVSSVLPEGTRITASGSNTFQMTQDINILTQQQQQSQQPQGTIQPHSLPSNLSQLAQTHGNIISVSAMPSQKLVSTTLPSNQLAPIAKISPGQIPSYRHGPVMVRHIPNKQAGQLQSQQVTQTVSQQQTLPRIQLSTNLTSQNTTQTSQNNPTIVATTVKPIVSNVMTSSGLSVALPINQQPRIFTSGNKQVIARANVTEAELAQIIRFQSRPPVIGNQKTLQIPASLTNAQIIQLQQSLQQSHLQNQINQQTQTQGSSNQTQQVVQVPVTIVKTVTTPSSQNPSNQTVTIPVSAVTMGGVNILNPQISKPITVTTNTVTTSNNTISPNLKQLQIIQQQKKAFQTTTLNPQQSIQIASTSASSQINSQLLGNQKISASLVNPNKAVSQGTGLNTIQIVQAPSNSGQQQTTKAINAVTVQQLQQVLKQHSLNIAHNIPHTIQMTPTSSSTGQFQSIIQVAPSKIQSVSQTNDSNQPLVTTTPVNVSHVNPVSSIKHIQVVASTHPSQTGVSPKNIVISSPSTLIQTAALHPSQTQTLTFAIRTSAPMTTQAKTAITAVTAQEPTLLLTKTEKKKDEIQATVSVPVTSTAAVSAASFEEVAQVLKSIEPERSTNNNTTSGNIIITSNATLTSNISANSEDNNINNSTNNKNEN